MFSLDQRLNYIHLLSNFSQQQPTYDWDPNKAWDHTPSWAQPQPQQEPQMYQMEQRYNVETNNTRSVINKPVPGRPATSSAKQTPNKPASSGTESSASTASGSLFVSDPLAFAKWDD